MFTRVHSSIPIEEKKNAVYRHLYEANIKQLIKEQKVITDTWKMICMNDAQAEVNNLIIDGNLSNYFNRLKAGAV